MKTISHLIAGNFLAVLALAQPSQYILTDLGNVGQNGQPFVISNNDLIAGDAAAGAGYHAVVWLLGVRIDMSAALSGAGFTGPNSNANWVNVWAQVVGLAETSEPDPEDFCGFGDYLVCLPFLSQVGLFGQTSRLPTLGGTNGAATAINDLGLIGGYAENTTPDSACPAPQKYEFKPLLWINRKAQELATVPGDPEGLVLAVNDKGEVAGASGICAPYNLFTGGYIQPLHAIFWDADGTPQEIKGLGGTGHFLGIVGKNLNNQGQVVGWSDLPGDLNARAFVWSNGHIEELGVLPGGVNSVGLAISDAGVVIGASIDAEFNPTAFIWQNGVMTALNALIPADSPLYLETACSINSLGQITGFAYNKSNGETHGYMLTPR